jgi:hypothetical protein
MPVRRRARAPKPAAVSGACNGCDAEGDLGSVAALLGVLHPALDLFDMTPDARQLALDGARVPTPSALSYRSRSDWSAASRFRSHDCGSTYSSVTSCPETVSVATPSPRPLLSSSSASSKRSEGTERIRSAYKPLSAR